MRTATPAHHQLNIFGTDFMPQLNPHEPILHLATEINWDVLEEGLKKHYNDSGPAQPIRLMVGLLLVKQLYTLMCKG